MNCQNHPNKESVATCVVCGKSICDECILNIAGKSYCHECVTEIVATEAPKRNKSQENLNNESNKDIEEKYEKYLDDLYYKEDKVANDKNNHKLSLKDQLARDEAAHGSIIREPRKPSGTTLTDELPPNDDAKSNLQSINDENKKNRLSLHPHIHSGEKKKKVEEESTTTEIALTIILIIMIILTVSYIIYLFTLATSYLSFFDAVYALFTNPAEVINNIFS